MGVRVVHAMVALTGSAQQLSGTARLRRISFTADIANVGAIRIGGNATIAAGGGERLPAPDAAIAVAARSTPPIVHGEFEDGALLLNDYWVIGVAADTLHLLLHVYDHYQGIPGKKTS